jgi:uncharacterized membrane protein
LHGLVELCWLVEVDDIDVAVWQTRVVSCFSDASGFAVGSVEGRCAIQYVEEKDSEVDDIDVAVRGADDEQLVLNVHGVDTLLALDGSDCMQSPLKWQTRVVSCFSDASGFAVGSVEGRCAIQYTAKPEASEKQLTTRVCHLRGDCMVL